MIRHTAVDVPPSVCYGQTDVPLLPTFPIEAKYVKERLGERQWDKVFTSPLSRCTRLAEACGYPDAVRDPRLLEMDFGHWEMMRWDDIDDPRLQEWYEDWFNVRATGGESFRMQRERVKDFIGSLAAAGIERAAAFTHGGVILQAMILAGMINEGEAFAHQPRYGDIIEISI